MSSGEIYVFDDGPLSHFAEAGWLGLLEAYVDGNAALLPDTVHQELQQGVDSHAHLRQVLDAPWLKLEVLASLEDLTALSTFTSRLLGDDGKQNLGECGVLALAKTRGALAVIDDKFARRVAGDEGVRHVTTLGLLLQIVQSGNLSMEYASRVADRLLETEYRLPIGEGGFRAWAAINGQYDDEQEEEGRFSP
ncbi:nucleotide-binding protein [Microbacterium sp.]|uniref:nucleotide-binding protein n=1 Tax=Microbacterium sp. TaxID=51671 RepID=UPI003568ADE5